MKCDNKVSGNHSKKLWETTIIYERNIKTINYGPLTIVWIISLTHLSDKCHPAVVQIMTVIFQSHRQQRPDSSMRRQNSVEKVTADCRLREACDTDTWDCSSRPSSISLSLTLITEFQFSVLGQKFTIEVATPKNQPVVKQAACERSLLLQCFYVCCQAVTSSGCCNQTATLTLF